MPNPIFESFLDPSTMLEAETRLLEQGVNAVPELRSLLSGESKNRYGVPYRDLGLPLRCALQVAMRLGPLARPLEPLLRDRLEQGDEAAARALGVLEVLDPATVRLLARQLDRYPDGIAMESARALIRCDCAGHPAVLQTLEASEAAETAWARAVAHMKR
jgi:hypothetical protein